MDQSAVKRIVEREIRVMAAALGIPHWKVTTDIGPIDREGNPAGYVFRQISYNAALIEIDPARIRDEDQLLNILRHELLHILFSPFVLFCNTVTAPMDHDSAEYRRLMEVWAFADEQAVINLERMWRGCEAYWRKRAMSVKKVGKGYENVSKTGKKFSKKPMSKGKAMAQLGAIEAGKAKAKAKGK